MFQKKKKKYIEKSKKSREKPNFLQIITSVDMKRGKMGGSLKETDIIVTFLLSLGVVLAPVNYLLPWRPSLELTSLSIVIVWISLCLVISVCLPEISQERLVAAERALLRTIKSGYEERWTEVVTAKNAVFRIHSIHVQHQRPHHPTPPAAAPAAENNGDGGGGDSRNIVVIHGHSAGVGHWEVVCDQLALDGHVHLIDLPGWGRSTWPENAQTIHDQVDVIDIHMEILGSWLRLNNLTTNVVIVGHSFGGMLAVHLATRFPELLDHVIIISPAGLFSVMPDSTYFIGIYFRFLTLQRFARITGRIGYVIFKRLFLKYSSEDRRFPDYYFQLAAATGRNGSADIHFGSFVRYHGRIAWWSHPILSLLLNMETPTTIMWGEDDPILPSRFAPILHRLCPQTDVYIIEKSKHNPAHSQPEPFVAAVRASIAKHTLSPRSKSREAVAGVPHPLVRRSTGVFRKKSEDREQIILGEGLGFCGSCHHEVHIFKSYWRCACGAWSYNAFTDLKQTRAEVDRMLSFLEELYVTGTFDAKNSPNIKFMKVKTPLYLGEVEECTLPSPRTREAHYTPGEYRTWA